MVKRGIEVISALDWPENVWMGVSVESSEHFERIDDLRRTRARLKFLSLEPLLGPLQGMDLQDIDWVIVGGESGPKARPVQEDWILDIREQCRQARVAFFFKQWGGRNKKKSRGRRCGELIAIRSRAHPVRRGTPSPRGGT